MKELHSHEKNIKIIRGLQKKEIIAALNFSDSAGDECPTRLFVKNLYYRAYYPLATNGIKSIIYNIRAK